MVVSFSISFSDLVVLSDLSRTISFSICMLGRAISANKEVNGAPRLPPLCQQCPLLDYVFIALFSIVGRYGLYSGTGAIFHAASSYHLPNISHKPTGLHVST